MLTASLGWTGDLPPRTPLLNRSLAIPAITSLVFMLVEVPLPVWKISRTNWSSCWPSATACAAWTIASPSSGGSSFRSMLTCAAAFLISPIARRNGRGNRSGLIWKFSTARCVWAPYRPRPGPPSPPSSLFSVRVLAKAGTPLQPDVVLDRSPPPRNIPRGNKAITYQIRPPLLAGPTPPSGMASRRLERIPRCLAHDRRAGSAGHASTRPAEPALRERKPL